MRVLVLDGHSDAAGACVTSLGRAGHEVLLGATRMDVAAWQSRFPCERLIYPDPQQQPEDFLLWLGAIVVERGIDRTLPVTDATITPLIGRSPGERPPGVILPPDHAYADAFDKLRTVQLAERLGVPVPNTRVIESMPEDASVFGAFPVYVKPMKSKVWRDGVGHSLVPVPAADEVEARAALRRFLPHGPVLLQESVAGHGVGVELLCREGETLVSFGHERLHEWPMTGGRSSYRRSLRPPAPLLDAAQKLMQALRWTGVAMVEFKCDGDDFYLMEINGRFWGSLPLALSSGVDFPRLLLEMLEGRAVAQPAYREGHYQRNLLADAGWLLANLRADRADPRVLARPRVASFLELLRWPLRREDWDHFHRDDPKPGLYQLRRLAADAGHLAADAAEPLWGHFALRGWRDRRRVAALRPQSVLVLCHGNIYRSPLAAYRLRQALGGAEVTVDSAGFHAAAGRACRDDYLALLDERGVDLRSHRSRVVDDAALTAADLIVLMDRRNAESLRALSPALLTRAVFLGSFAPGGGPWVMDPYGRSEPVQRAIIDRVDAACVALAHCLEKAAAGTVRGVESVDR